MTIRAVSVLVAACVLSACAERGASSSFIGCSADARVAALALRGTPIKHVVFIVQENRSFNNLFLGFPGATTAKYGLDNDGKKVKVRARALATSWDLGHSSGTFFIDCDGQSTIPGTHCKMDGWNQGGILGQAPPNAPYSYVPQSQIQPYWTLAQQYVLADRMFPSNLDGSFVSHQYIVAAFASSTVNIPNGLWGCGQTHGNTVPTITQQRTIGPSVVPCFKNPTIASEADAAGLSWRFYASPIAQSGGIWSSYQADKPIYDSPDWKADVVNPSAQFLTDVGNGKLAAITWITPTYETSDHPGTNPAEGPAWVASLVNAVGESKFWDSTAIFIFWDDWGGFSIRSNRSTRIMTGSASAYR